LQNITSFPKPTKMSSVKDDSFQLYDLRVEVVCPPGERILCGAKEGDYFTVQGEMLHLPDGQGISFYSLGELYTRMLHTSITDEFVIQRQYCLC
jgi:uncharacterized repeat protein (TIGR04076 family)